MTMDLPKSMILGEEVLVQITVFNYMSVSQQVFLQVVRSDDPINAIQAATMIRANEGHSTYVRVTPKALGTLKINVHAKAGFFATSATDAIEKEVTVLPMGVHKTVNDQHLVDVSSGIRTFTKTIFLKDPKNMVPGTKNACMQITGNFMVPSIFGLQKLIQIPHGCGEQTMVNFAPDVYITKYMNVTSQLTEDVKNTAISAIKSGYQHELEYRHSDGSFSIWGETYKTYGRVDQYGSTWLTAYVLKCFHQAKSLITIDSNVLTTAMNWLLLQQNTDGSFREMIPVYYVDHRHTGTGIKLTAFTLISIMECRNIPNVQANAVSSAIVKGKKYLESRLSTVSDAYTLSIVCYALALSKSSFGPSCFTKLDHSKHVDGDYVYWQERTTIVRRQTITRSSQTRAPARDIETSAYALLTYMTLGHHAGAFPIVKWLVAQRNPYGGFSSTQDTVISIQALTEYAMKHSSIASNYGVQFNTFGMNFMHSYTASQHNFDSLHTVEIPSSLDNVIVQAMGDGIAVVDVVQSFYVSSVGNGSYISVAADIEKESLNSITVRANIQWNGPTSSHMIMMEIETPTGFVVDRDFFIKQAHVRKHETNGRKVALYLDEITQNGQSVVTVKMDRSDPVVKNQACHIIVYDYYEPTYQAVTRYESGLLKSQYL
ncbi:CD109 antigen-like isoform X2 [Ruditapes philippinarum]|uniref:CD109 antigen-like isoform X2 n=1 Tax=Ruditapes philippinarum TaxID=129788 RepID=UPI00295AFAB6|nr:CD109 antigen-like isoform X2 [Ruditapes philippinarum]